MQSYLLLQPDAPDPTIVALQAISIQLSSFATQGQFFNSTSPAFSLASIPPAPSPQLWAVWLNIVWFSSLILSLAAAVIGITVKQWIHEYLSGLWGTSREIARLREYRLQGLTKWRVDMVVAVLPLLLQVALGLFLAGLLILLWNLHHTVACVASALVGTLVLFSVCTTVLPLLQPDCAYLSPQSLGLFYAWEKTRYATTFVLGYILYPVRVALAISNRAARNAVRYCCSVLGLAPFLVPLWFRMPARRSMLQTYSYPLWSYDDDTVPQHVVWRGREQLAVERAAPALDSALVARAYTTTMDPARLDVAVACLAGLTRRDLWDCFRTVCMANARRWGLNTFGEPWASPVRPEVSAWVCYAGCWMEVRLRQVETWSTSSFDVGCAPLTRRWLGEVRCARAMRRSSGCSLFWRG